MDTMPRVSIIILNWNGWKDTIECLESVYQINYPNYDIIVVDNNSENNSIDRIKEYAEGNLEVTSKFLKHSGWNKPIHYIEYSSEEIEAGHEKETEIANLASWRKLILIKNGKNHGFAEGNNIAIRYALKALNPGYILLLNNDTVVDEVFLDELVKIAESDESIGLVGPKVYYYDCEGKTDVINFAGGVINWFLGTPTHLGLNIQDNGQFNEVKSVDFITGAALCIRSEVFEKVGLLNSKYFAYWEDADFCVRAHEQSYKLVYIPSSKIWHKVSSSSKTISGFSLYQITRNMFWFMKSHASMCQYCCWLLYYFSVKFWFRLITYPIRYQDPKLIMPLINGVIDGTMQDGTHSYFD